MSHQQGGAAFVTGQTSTSEVMLDLQGEKIPVEREKDIISEEPESEWQTVNQCKGFSTATDAHWVNYNQFNVCNNYVIDFNKVWCQQGNKLF